LGRKEIRRTIQRKKRLVKKEGRRNASKRVEKTNKRTVREKIKKAGEERGGRTLFQNCQKKEKEERAEAERNREPQICTAKRGGYKIQRPDGL